METTLRLNTFTLSYVPGWGLVPQRDWELRPRVTEEVWLLLAESPRWNLCLCGWTLWWCVWRTQCRPGHMPYGHWSM